MTLTVKGLKKTREFPFVRASCSGFWGTVPTFREQSLQPVQTTVETFHAGRKNRGNHSSSVIGTWQGQQLRHWNVARSRVQFPPVDSLFTPSASPQGLSFDK